MKIPLESDKGQRSRKERCALGKGHFSICEINFLFQLFSCLIDPISARAFCGFFLKKYRNFDFVTQFLRNGSTKSIKFCISSFRKF